ncbi:glycosyltransferase family 39 protein [Afipia sp. Root123D2]|uniref:glycosyltransferase family 39 protein n=1 Tax=Afipia sp. Root123D2 TaxID=1736436 RepID=UPI0009EA361A|nr:glycosyltransferase family 39 protein [Afipia sp. Root123D2]
MSDTSTIGPKPRTGLKSRQKARLRHVPVTRRVAAWIVAAAEDERTGFRFVIGFAFVHALLWTIILTALKGAQDIHMDVAEAYAWGQKFLLGYGKHPPLAGWVAGVWFRVFPVTDWATYALAMVVVSIGLVLCWLIAVRVVDHRRAMFTVAMLAIYPIFNIKGFKYNPDLLQLVTLPLVVLAYLNAFDKRTVRAGIWLGLAGAVAVLTKYWVLTMIGAVGLAALMHPQRLAFLRSPAPWIALLTMAVALTPHFLWLKQVDFVPLTYAEGVYGSRTFAASLKLVTSYALHTIGLLLAAFIAAYVALTWKLQWWKSIRSRGVFREIVDSAKRPWVRGSNPGVDGVQALNIWLIQGIVAVGPPLGALVFGIYMKTDWGISLFFLTPLALIAIPALRVTQMALIRLLLIWAIFTFTMLLLSPIIAAQHVPQHGDRAAPFRPRSEFALQLTEAWRARFNTRWAIVAATTEAGDSMTFYSPDHPLTFTPGELWSSGLTSLEKAMQSGFIGICDTTDARLPKCETWMNENAADAEKLNITSRRYFHGKAGPAVRWKIWIKAPLRPEPEED